MVWSILQQLLHVRMWSQPLSDPTTCKAQANEMLGSLSTCNYGPAVSFHDARWYPALRGCLQKQRVHKHTLLSCAFDHV